LEEGSRTEVTVRIRRRPPLRARLVRLLRRVVAIAMVLLAAAILALYLTSARFRAFGAAPEGKTLQRIEASPQFTRGAFRNAEPTVVMRASTWDSTRRWLSGTEMRTPSCPLPLAGDTAKRLAEPPASGLRVTWLGHSTTLVEIDGFRILTDPNWSERSSPTTLVGPRRFHPPPLALADLPRIDAVLVSHEHFDHLDMATVVALATRGVPFHVPLGIGAHLLAFGIPEAQIVQHDWWGASWIARHELPEVARAARVAREGEAGALSIVSTPSRHFNGRGPPWRIGALWTSWSLVGPTHRVFFSGDTGLTDGFAEIARRHGPFDLAMLEIGQFHPDWGEIHLGPAGALMAHGMLGAKHLLPIHWGTFQLAYHAWSEPAETLYSLVERQLGRPSLLTPRLGQPIEPPDPDDPRADRGSPWWRALPPIAAACP